METTKRYGYTDDVEWDMYLLQTYTLEGLLPITIDPQNVSRVLDVPCRLGHWADALAYAYPHMHVTAQDNNPHHIVAIQQRTDHPDNVQFEISDLASDLKGVAQKKKAKFDLIHVDAPLVFCPPQGWSTFLEQCKHRLKCRGIINLVNIVPGPASSDAYQRIVYLARQWEGIAPLAKTPTRGISTSGVDEHVAKTPTRGVSTSGVDEHVETPLVGVFAGGDRSPGATTFCRLLKQVGFTQIGYTLHPIDLSGQAYQRFLDNTIQEIEQSLCDAQLTSKEDLAYLLALKQRQANDPYFCAMGMIISILARKP